MRWNISLSDETFTRCLKTNCYQHEFKCAYGACIAESCIDGSDEVGCQDLPPVNPFYTPDRKHKPCKLPSSNRLFARDTVTHERIHEGGFLRSGSSYSYHCSEPATIIDICKDSILYSSLNVIFPTYSKFCSNKVLSRNTIYYYYQEQQQISLVDLGINSRHTGQFNNMLR